MIKRIKAFVFIFVLLVVSVAALPVFAQGTQDRPQIPERDGDYPDPGHPGLRVRVFVHNPQKPTPVSSDSVSLVCPSDPESSAVVPPAGWHLPNGTWNYFLNTSSVPSSVGSSNLSIIASNAFGKWSSSVGGKVNFSQVGTTLANRARFDGQNIIAWGRTSANALAVTYTWYYISNNLVAEEDTIFNMQYPWYWNLANSACTDTNSYDAQDILTHETGHWMGLKDTYDVAYTNNTMFGYGSKGETKKDTLTTGDVSGVQAIYP